MLRRYFFSFILIIFALSAIFAGEVSTGLELNSFLGLSLTNADFIYNKTDLNLKVKSILSEEIFLYGCLGTSYTGIFQENISTKNNLENASFFYPVEFSVDEAYISIKNFLLSGFDLQAGKQRISWGKADKINPTDVLNPVDLSMITDLAKKIPTLALNLKYYFPGLEDTGIQVVAQPYSGQSVLPVTFVEKRLTDKIKKNATNVSALEIDENWNGSVITPAYNITNGLIGGKIFGKIYGFDLSLSATRRINDIPYVKEIYLSNEVTIDYSHLDKTNAVVKDKYYLLDYHKETIIGFDMAKDWGIFLSWIELSVTFPDETKTKTYTFSSNIINNLSIPIPVPPYIITTNISTNTSLTEEKTILKDPYVKFVAGVDKNFDGGWYINFQYAHGLFMERGYEDERLQDYFVLNLEKTFFDDKLKFRLYGIADVDNIVERFKDSDITKSFMDNSAFMGAFEVCYSPLMGVNLKLGVMGIDGNGEATLAMYKDYDMVYLEFSTSF